MRQRLIVRDPSIRVIEPCPIKDEYACRLARIEEVDLGARFVLVSEHYCYEAGDEVVFPVCNKIILPWEWIPAGIRMAGEFAARRTASVAGQGLLLVVRG